MLLSHRYLTYGGEVPFYHDHWGEKLSHIISFRFNEHPHESYFSRSKHGSTHFLPLTVSAPVLTWVTASLRTRQASFAKSRSRTSATGTDTIANASLSSLTLARPTWKHSHVMIAWLKPRARTIRALLSICRSRLSWENVLARHCKYMIIGYNNCTDICTRKTNPMCTNKSSWHFELY